MAPAPRRSPRYSPASVCLFVQNLAAAIVKERGECDDSILRIRLVEALEKDPSRIHLERVAKDWTSFWHECTNEKLNGEKGQLFVPGAFVTIKRAISVPMKIMRQPHLESYRALTLEIIGNFNKRMDKRVEWIEQRLDEFAAHPDFLHLLALETKLHGYVRKAGDDTPFSERDA